MKLAVIQFPLAKWTQQGASKLVLVLFLITILLTALVTAMFAHRVGYAKGYKVSTNEFLVESNGEEITADNVGALRVEVDLLQSKLQTATQERDISLSNLAELRRKQRELEITNLQLQQAVEVFSNQLRQRGGLGLQIVAAKIVPLPESTYEYRFDIAMLPENNKSRTLVPHLTLLTNESMVEVPLDPVEYTINGISRIRGRFVMPKDFEPMQAKLELSAAGENVTQVYDWDFDTKVEDMPLLLEEVPETDPRPITDEED